jgi:aldehyde dehydrogenase (NAD+)
MRTLDGCFIAGRFKPAAGTTHTLLSPVTEEPHAAVTYAAAGDVDAAVGAARAAAPEWRRVPPEARAQILALMGTHLHARADELARDFAVEIGAPLGDARTLHVDLGLRVFSQAPLLAKRVAEVEMLDGTQVLRVPVGVAACITPWNYPLYQIATKIVPALVAGTTVVLKPSEVAPLFVKALCAAAQAAGLPAGVLNVLVGGAEIGKQLVAHPGIDLVSFTGSTAIGREVAEMAGRGLKKVTLELGGKSASVLLADGDLHQAVRQTLAKCLQNAGQTCSALTRLLVPRGELAEALALAATEAQSYRMGDPFEASTRLGPVISAAQRDKIGALVSRALAAGARAVTGGAASPTLPARGYFVAPTVLLVERPDAEIVQQEVFGPVLCVQAYGDEDEAIALANGTDYSLAAAVWSRDRARAERVALQLRAGSVSLNGARTHPDAPFGGFGASGFGRERGRHGLETYLTTQALHA